MREGRVWLVLVGGFVLVFLWALSADDVPTGAPPARVAVSSASSPQLQWRPSRSAALATPAPAASAAPAVEAPVCDPAAADAKPSEADDAKVLQDLDAALAARSSERAEAVRHYIAGAVNALAGMAVQTPDPAIYALAYQACRKRSAQGCQMVSARQWARIDPHNAMPWLRVADEAMAERNEAAVAEAMYQVARSTRSDGYEGAFVREVLAALPKDLTPLAHGLLAERVLGIEAAWVLPGTQTALRHCSNLNTRDANRRQLCSDVAETLFRRSNTIVEQTVGIGIGRRSGWAVEKVEAAQAERDAMMQVLRQQIVPVPDKDMNACETGVLAIRALRQLAERGEAGSAREALRRSGKSVAEWAAAYRAARERERQWALGSGRAAAASAVVPPAGG